MHTRPLMLTNWPRADRFVPVLRALAAVLLLVAATSSASAQTESGGLASVTVSAFAINDETKASFAAGIGYRFNRVVALGVELTAVPDFMPRVQESPLYPLATSFNGLIYPSPIYRYEPAGGHATFFTGNLRLTVPTRSTRISPYMMGGAGVAAVRSEIDSVIDYGPIILASIPASLPRTIAYPVITQRLTHTTTDITLTMGGGVSLMMTDQWSVDADARYIAVTGEASGDLGRFGAGLTYRF